MMTVMKVTALLTMKQVDDDDDEKGELLLMLMRI